MTINVDVCPVEDEQEALFLMLHHLKLAATYFEATPTTFDIPDTFSKPAMRAWLDGMEKLYPED